MAFPRSRVLWAMVAVGTIARLVVAFATYGHAFDMDSFGLVRDQLAADPLHVYSHVTFDVGGGIELLRWPYPPAFFAWIAAAGALDGPLGLPFDGLIQVPAILADAAIAVLVYAFLAMRGAAEQTRLLAAGLVALGPAFAIVSGYHGQLDSVAIVCAVAALCVWETHVGRRALIAGLLIGLGAALKTVPLLMLIALLPAARDNRERLTLVIAAGAVPALVLAPFLAADPSGAAHVFGYNGVPGVAGLSLVLQPGLGASWLTAQPIELSPASEFLNDLGGIPTLIGLAGAAVLLWRRRVSAVDGAVVVWLTVYVFSPNLFLHYGVWGLPFFLMAGYARAVLAVEAALLVPMLLVYTLPWSSRSIDLVYAPLVIGLWAASVIALYRVARRILDDRAEPDVATSASRLSYASMRRAQS